jgi:bZIP transcription factor
VLVQVRQMGTDSNNRTPSPDHIMGGNSNDADVPSPLAASTSSSTSEHSHSHHAGHHYGVPNPFASAAPAPPHPGWGSHAYETGALPPPPPPPHPGYQYHHHPHAPSPGVPMVVSAPAPTPPSYHTHAHAWARDNSCPNFSIGTTDPKSPSSTTKGSKAAKRRSYSKASSTSSLASDNNNEPSNGVGGVGDSVNSRRQKRLERNRESARLSRRRRKQYLEILEERVTQLSMEVDQGRRAHASQAVTTTLYKRREVLEATDKSDEEKIKLLEHGLGRTSPEMMVVSTFKYQQLKSFSLPPQSKFILWLTLQNDQYFRGGRAASERLSAARIGERVSSWKWRPNLWVSTTMFLILIHNVVSNGTLDAEQWKRSGSSCTIYVAPFL